MKTAADTQVWREQESCLPTLPANNAQFEVCAVDVIRACSHYTFYILHVREGVRGFAWQIVCDDHPTRKKINMVGGFHAGVSQRARREVILSGQQTLLKLITADLQYVRGS